MILAIDPSIAKPGWCVMRPPTGLITDPRDVTALYVDSGWWQTLPADDPASRLAYLAQECGDLARLHDVTRAFVETPATAGVYRSHAKDRFGRAKSQGAREAMLGGSLGTMQQAVGAFLAALGAICPTETVKASNPPRTDRGGAKEARRSTVLSYWPRLADRGEDEIDAVYLALTVATDNRRKWRSVPDPG